jgi:hypothetical protein
LKFVLDNIACIGGLGFCVRDSFGALPPFCNILFENISSLEFSVWLHLILHSALMSKTLPMEKLDSKIKVTVSGCRKLWNRNKKMIG